MNKTQVFFRRHSSTILTVVGSVGVVATTVLAVKATPKALLLLEEAKEEKGGDLTPVETVKAAWKPYVPTVFAGVSTIACILGINYLGTKGQASLMSAYAVLNSSYQEFMKKTEELYGKESITNIKNEIIKSKLANVELNPDEEIETFFDFQSMRPFESTFAKVKEAERIFLQNFVKDDYACLNDYYDLVGLPHVDYGYQVGWSAASGYNISELEFQYEKMHIDDGSEEGMDCWAITMPYPPATDLMF